MLALFLISTVIRKNKSGRRSKRKFKLNSLKFECVFIVDQINGQS